MNDKNKRKTAIALQYDPPRDAAPRVAAKGSGQIAERIIEIAKEHGVPIHEDPDLIKVLSALDIYQEIPPELYAVIAEVLAYVYRMNLRYRG